MRRRRFYRLTAAGRKVLDAAPELEHVLRGAQPRRRHPAMPELEMRCVRAPARRHLRSTRRAPPTSSTSSRSTSLSTTRTSSIRGLATRTPRFARRWHRSTIPRASRRDIARADRPRATRRRRRRHGGRSLGRSRPRRALRRPSASARSGLRRHRAADARARHRRQHGDLQRAQRGAAAAAALRRSRAARADRRARTRRRRRTTSATRRFSTGAIAATRFEEMALIRSWNPTLIADGEAGARSAACASSANFFRTLGVQPAIGRDFTRRRTTRRPAGRSCILSDGVWRRTFGADPGDRRPGRSR